MTKESYVDLSKARTDDQLRVMQDIQNEGHCPFDLENLEKYHKEPILRRGEHWLLTPNQWPYDNTRVHLLAIATTHVETLQELQPGSMDELLAHLQWAEFTYNVAAGGLAMRFGDVQRNGATVNHLHAHFIVPEDELPPEVKVRFKIS